MTRVAGRLTTELARYKDVAPAEALRELVRQHSTLILTHPLQFRVVERNEHHLPPKRRENAAASRRAVLENFADVIERGMRSGEFGLVDAKVAALAILGMCNWTAWWYQPGGRRSREEIASMLADFAVKALEQEGKKRPRDAGVGESLRLLRKELAYLEQRIGDEPT